MTLLRVNFPETEFVPLITWRKAEVAMRVKIADQCQKLRVDSDAGGDTCNRNSELSCYACVSSKKIATGRGAIGEEFAERRRSHEVTHRAAALATALVAASVPSHQHAISLSEFTHAES